MSNPEEQKSKGGTPEHTDIDWSVFEVPVPDDWDAFVPKKQQKNSEIDWSRFEEAEGTHSS